MDYKIMNKKQSGLLARLRTAFDQRRAAFGGYGNRTEIATFDFINGFYAIDGKRRTRAECFNGLLGGYNVSNFVAGVGYQVRNAAPQTKLASGLQFTPELVAALLSDNRFHMEVEFSLSNYVEVAPGFVGPYMELDFMDADFNFAYIDLRRYAPNGSGAIADPSQYHLSAGVSSDLEPTRQVVTNSKHEGDFLWAVDYDRRRDRYRIGLDGKTTMIEVATPKKIDDLTLYVSIWPTLDKAEPHESGTGGGQVTLTIKAIRFYR